SSLVIDKEEAHRTERASEASSENVLLHRGSLLIGTIQEELIRVQHVVAEKLVGVAVETLSPGLQNCVDIAAAVAALAGVVEGSLDFEFFDYVGIRKRDIGGSRD